jgi:hypothetical protein
VSRVDPRKDSTTAWVGTKGASGGASTGFPAGQDKGRHGKAGRTKAKPKVEGVVGNSQLQ